MNRVTTNGFFSLLIFYVAGAFFSCTNVELPPPETPAFCDAIVASYNTNVKDIIDQSCAYSGCHDGSGGIGLGDYTSYSEILGTGVLENGSFRNRVFGQKDDPVAGMPPNQSVYTQSQKDDLTEEELQILECWLAQGYPEDV